MGAWRWPASSRRAAFPRRRTWRPSSPRRSPWGRTWKSRASSRPGGWGSGCRRPSGILLVRSVLFQARRGLPGILGHVTSSFFTFLYPGFFLAWIVRISGPAGAVAVHPLLSLPGVRQRHVGVFRREPLGTLHPAEPPREPAEERGRLRGGPGRVSRHASAFSCCSRPGFRVSRSGSLSSSTVATGIMVILGDLLESGLKRSARVKDSGIVIPGRGGHAGFGGFDAAQRAAFLLPFPPPFPVIIVPGAGVRTA